MQDQNTQERKVGVIRSWHENRGFGIVRVGPPSSLEKYFLHVSGIKRGTSIPTVGMAVEFEVSDKQPKDGQLRAAINAVIDVDSTTLTQESDGTGGAK